MWLKTFTGAVPQADMRINSAFVPTIAVVIDGGQFFLRAYVNAASQQSTGDWYYLADDAGALTFTTRAAAMLALNDILAAGA